jgi:hypothetical protein
MMNEGYPLVVIYFCYQGTIRGLVNYLLFYMPPTFTPHPSFHVHIHRLIQWVHLRFYADLKSSVACKGLCGSSSPSTLRVLWVAGCEIKYHSFCRIAAGQPAFEFSILHVAWTLCSAFVSPFSSIFSLLTLECSGICPTTICTIGPAFASFG